MKKIGNLVYLDQISKTLKSSNINQENLDLRNSINQNVSINGKIAVILNYLVKFRRGTKLTQ
jgi:hypothetical protein